MAINTKRKDYQFALEGLSYATAYTRRNMDMIDEIIKGLSKPDVMDGETGKEYCKRLSEAVNVVNACIERFNAFGKKVEEICKKNGAFVDQKVMEDFDQTKAMFNKIAGDISSHNGTKRS